MEKHVTVLGALYIAFNILGIMAAFIVFTVIVGGGLLSGDSEAIVITSIVGTVIAFFLSITSLPGIVGGFGLLKRKYWAKILVTILGCINLIHIPFGTVLGIYTLWVLLNKETEKEFVT